MKGWRPSACPKARNRIGLGEAGEFLPDIGSIGLSFSARSSVGLMTRGSVDPGSLFALIRLRGRQSRTNDAQASAIMKRRQPFTSLAKQPEEPKTKTEGPTMNPGRTRDAYFAAAFEAGIGFEKKKCLGGQRKSLKRLNSAKESEAFNLDFVPPDLEFSHPAWISSGNLDFLHPAGHSWAATRGERRVARGPLTLRPALLRSQTGAGNRAQLRQILLANRQFDRPPQLSLRPNGAASGRAGGRKIPFEPLIRC